MEFSQTTATPSGILIIDKPSDWTSFDVVAKIRRVFNTKKVGHAGTLDPMATGVLIVLVGKATKLSNQLLAQDKRYIAEITFGQATDTGDAEGNIIDTDDASHLTEAGIQKILPTLLGSRDQMVPAFAAVKIGGKKLYELARAGKPVVDRPVKHITIHSMDVLGFEPGAGQKPPKATIEIHCSKGTYIRVLAEEIAAKLGTVAHLTALRRTASGQFNINQAVLLQTLIDTPNPMDYLQSIESEIIKTV